MEHSSQSARAIERYSVYLDGVAALRRGDYTSFNNLVRASLRDTDKEITKAELYSPEIVRAMAGLQRAKLALREAAARGYGQDLQNLQDQEDDPESSADHFDVQDC